MKSSYSQTIQNLSVEKRTINRRLKKLEEFEEKISFFLSGALAEGDISNIKPGLGQGMGGGDDLEIGEEFDLQTSPMDSEFALPLTPNNLETPEERVTYLKKRIKELANLALKEKKRLDYTPSILPVQGYLTSKFGWRISPFTGRRHLHRGIDLVNRIGTPIKATAAGKVIFAGKENFWGNAVFIEHRDGIVTKYGHMSSIAVSEGQSVHRGEIIGYIGMSGRTTGPHVHYQIEINEKPVDPLQFVIEEVDNY